MSASFSLRGAEFRHLDWPDAEAFAHKLPDGREIRLFSTFNGKWEASFLGADGSGGAWLRQKRKGWTGWRGSFPPKRLFGSAEAAGRAALKEWQTQS